MRARLLCLTFLTGCTLSLPADLPDWSVDAIDGGDGATDIKIPKDSGPTDSGPTDSGPTDADSTTSDSKTDSPDPQQVVEEIANDPFNDGTPFSFVTQYGDWLYFGPKQDGTGAVRTKPDGSLPEPVTFSFNADVSGADETSNPSKPYESIGSAGCEENTSDCGPDNEDGRGIFAAGELGGQSLLLVGGARSGGNLDYVYLTTDSGPALTFRYVDLSDKDLLGGQTKGISSMHAAPGGIYLGLIDTGGSKPYLLVLKTLPSHPGLEAAKDTDVVNLNAKEMEGIKGAMMVDSITTFDGLIFIANSGGFMRSTVTDPGPTDWVPCTPTAPAYEKKSIVLASPPDGQPFEVEPADKAVPAFATFKGQLYAARNTVEGPQLWVCASSPCESDTWSLIAANSSGDPQLTEFNNTKNKRISFLAATEKHLYVGFNNDDGIVVFRSTNDKPLTRGDFEGQAACSAADHPATCAGLGSNGLGEPTNKRIFHGVAVTFTGTDNVYLAAGDGKSAVRVYRILD